MRSMTSYATHTAVEDGINIKLEIKSLNSKGLDLKVRVPDIFNQLHYKVYTYLRKQIIRGKVNCRVEFDFSPDYSVYKLNKNNLKLYSDFVGEIRKETGYNKDISALDIMRMPDMLKSEIDEDLEKKIETFLFKELNVLLQKFNKVRELEGTELKDFFVKSIDIIKESVTVVDKNRENHLNSIKEKLLGRIEELNLNVSYDKNRFEEELLYYAEKSDITEEIVRLDSHMKMFLNEIEKTNNGKKLDFILQEMNRESNTIASKSNYVEIINKTIILKETISKMREQVANIE